MGRKRRKYDSEARAASSKVKKIESSDKSGEKAQVELDFAVDESKYDEANTMILPEKGSGEKKIAKGKPLNKGGLPRLRSKKEYKKLVQIMKRRDRKCDRQQILQELSKYQVSQDELKQMVSVSTLQTTGLKQTTSKTHPKKDRQVDLDELAASTDDSEDEDDDAQGDLAGASSEESKIPSDKTDTSNKEDVSEVDFSLFKVKPALVVEEEDDDAGDGKQAANEKNKMSHQPKDSSTSRKKVYEKGEAAIYVPVTRKPEIIESRMKLPIISEEQAIMEAIRYNDVTIICGETGSGKTTQLPQFLYEAGYAQSHTICITEPRRVAAMAMSRRVAEEMSLSTRVVSYHIRYEGNVTKDTKIKFVTDGVLLREIQENFLLTGYSVIIIDEAHERSVFSDILMGILSRIVALRRKKMNPLKLIIMSATLRVDDFAKNPRLFSPEPPVIKVEARQFPVSIHFSKSTPDNHINAAFAKVCKIHQTQPSGGILVFVTGRNEVNTLCRKLKKTFPSSKNSLDVNDDESTGGSSSRKSAEAVEKKAIREMRKSKKIKKIGQLLPTIDLDNFAEQGDNDKSLIIKDDQESDDDSAADVDDEQADDEDTVKLLSITNESQCEPLYCLPLYSMLPKHRQEAVFQKAPIGHRLCVVATNVAETSLTIPDIKYVVDTGKVKKKLYDKTTGVSAFLTTWCSKASADQRSGRAGRTSAGHCYRLYSSAVFNNDFPQFTEPEILVKPIDDLVLQLTSLNINNIVNFPFPTSPDREGLIASEKRLQAMGALQEIAGVKGKKLTQLGRVMAKFPLNPRYSKMLAYSYPELLPFVIALVAGLTVQEIFLSQPIVDTSDSIDAQDTKALAAKASKWREQVKKWSGSGNSYLLGDLMVLVKAIGASEYAGNTIDFCTKYGILHKSMVEVHKLRKQLAYEVERATNASGKVARILEPPDDTHALHLRQIATAGFFDHVAR